MIFNAILEEIHNLKPEVFIQSVEDALTSMSAEYQSDFECYRELQSALNEEIVDESCEDAEEALFKVKKYLARSNLKWRSNLTKLSEMRRREEKVHKNLVNSNSSRSRTDSGNVLAAASSASTDPSAATGNSVDNVDDGVAGRVYREWRSKGPNYDSVLKSPFPRKL